MARPKKDEPSSENPAPGADGAMVPVEDFKRTRDTVMSGLMGLQYAVTNLMQAFMKHCNETLGEEGPEGTFTMPPFSHGQIPDAALDKKEKKKRVKKERDPDMPKRPLTAAFLYGQTARPIVKVDLEKNLAPGEKLGANAVNEEVNRRWNAMPEEEKESWRSEYRKNRDTYDKEMEEYKAKHAAAGAVIDPEVLETAEDVEDVEAGAADSEEKESEDESEDNSPSPPPKAPTPPPASKSSKRRKTTKENGVAAAPKESPVPLPTVTKPTVIPPPSASKSKRAKDAKPAVVKEATPEETPNKKKRVRKSKGADETEAAPEPEKRDRKRKRKE